MAGAGRTLAATSALMLARLAGAGMTFAAQLLVSRLLGPAALGEFLLVLAAVGICAAALPLGFQTLAQYFVAEYDTDAGRGLQSGFLATAYQVVLVTSAALAASATMLSFVAPDLAGFPGVTAWTALVALAAPAAALLSVGTGALLALKSPYLALLPDLLAKPLGVLSAAVALAAAGRLSPFTLAVAFCLVLWTAALVQAVGLRRALVARGIARHRPAKDMRRWWSFAPAWLIIILVAEFTVDFDLLLLGAFLPADDIGVLGAAIRIFVLQGFGLAAVYSLTLPGVFAAGRNGSDETLSDAVAQANLAAVLVALGCLGVTALFGPLLLAMFGPAFVAAQPALLILAASLVARALFGPAAVLLSVFDRPYASIPPLLAGLVLLMILNAIWVPAYGIVGAAAALSVAMSFWSAAQWLTAWRLTGRNVALRPGDLRLIPALLLRREPA